MKQFLGLILTAALTMSLVSGPSYNESVEAAKPTDIDWLKQIKTSASKAASTDNKVKLNRRHWRKYIMRTKAKKTRHGAKVVKD